MNGPKCYALDENEEVPYEFVVTRNVNGELKFCATFVNTNTLDYGNGALLKLHQRNDELRAENAKLWELVSETLIRLAAANEAAGGGFVDARYCELLESHGIEVD